jgi:hypothetical protein
MWRPASSTPSGPTGHGDEMTLHTCPALHRGLSLLSGRVAGSVATSPSASPAPKPLRGSPAAPPHRIVSAID